MSIVLVGGHDRMQEEYKVIAAKRGYKIKVFIKMPPKLDKVIGSPDAIVLFTNTVSHKMVVTAIKTAKKKKIPVVRSHTSSGNSLEETLDSLRSCAC